MEIFVCCKFEEVPILIYQLTALGGASGKYGSLNFGNRVTILGGIDYKLYLQRSGTKLSGWCGSRHVQV